MLQAGQRLLAASPQAGRVLAALVAEGRRFAQTPEGRRWQDILSRSDLVRRGRMIWQAWGLDGLLQDKVDTLPSEWLDELLKQVSGANMEALLSALMAEGGQDGAIGRL